MAKLYFELKLGRDISKFSSLRKENLRWVFQRIVDGGVTSVDHELIQDDIYLVRENKFEIVIRNHGGQYTVISIKNLS